MLEDSKNNFGDMALLCLTFITSCSIWNGIFINIQHYYLKVIHRRIYKYEEQVALRHM